MSLPSETVTLADGSLITLGMRGGDGVSERYLKVHASRPDLTKNSGASPLAADDAAAIADQLGLGVLGDADAKLLSDVIAKVRG
jgi:hypothetical protein